MPKGGNCMMDDHECAIYDSKGQPGSHRCRALKGVPEDSSCVCNPPSATRSGARCSFRADRNERRRDDRVAKKSQENSPSSQPLPKSLSPNIGLGEAFKRHIPVSATKSPKLPNEVSPELDPLTAMYAALQKGKSARKYTTRASVAPLKAMEAQLVEAATDTSAVGEIPHPYATSAAELASSPKKTLSRVARRSTKKQSATTKQMSELPSGTSAASVAAGDAELTALAELDLPVEPTTEKRKRGPSQYNTFVHKMTEELKRHGVTDSKLRKEIALTTWNSSKLNPRNSSGVPVVAETTLAPGATLPVKPVVKNPLVVRTIKRSELKPIVEESETPAGAAWKGINAFT